MPGVEASVELGDGRFSENQVLWGKLGHQLLETFVVQAPVRGLVFGVL